MSLFPAGSASYGPEGRPSLYRYALTREWSEAPRLMFCGINPSTATESEDDPTIRRCVGFARREGAGGLVMVNVFGFRSKDVDALADAVDPVGPLNLGQLDWWGRRLGRAVLAYGRLDKIPCHLREHVFTAVATLRAAGCRFEALDLTAGGHPAHPARLPNVLRPRPIEPEGLGWRWSP